MFQFCVCLDLQIVTPYKDDERDPNANVRFLVVPLPSTGDFITTRPADHSTTILVRPLYPSVVPELRQALNSGCKHAHR
jgi:hypothetical protein